MGNSNTLEVSDIHYSYEKGKEILHGISTEFARGRITALIGANGCGKSTLLNLIAGVMQPDSGKILLNGKNIAQMKKSVIAQNIAVVHQSNTAPGDMTVEKLISLGRTPYKGLFKVDRERDIQAVYRAMSDTDTLKISDRAVSALSGGQMQRVWLAMALAQETDILLLDEITTYLDVHYQLEILHLIRELNRKKGITIIMVLHDINHAMEFCDEVAIMKNGAVKAAGAIEKVVNESVLNEAFDVNSEIIEINGRKHCVFSRKGEKYEH